MQKVRPNEIYNLAAQSHVKVSFEEPEYTGQVDGICHIICWFSHFFKKNSESKNLKKKIEISLGIGTLRLLEAIRTCGMVDSCKFYQASTSELYGKVMEIPQSETTPFYPRSPYGVSKLYAFWITKNYREA